MRLVDAGLEFLSAHEDLYGALLEARAVIYAVAVRRMTGSGRVVFFWYPV